VAIANADGDVLGDALVELFQSEELAELVSPTLVADRAAALEEVEADNAAAAIYIPPGFTASILPSAGAAQGSSAEAVEVELYLNPGRPTTGGVVQAIVEEFLNRVETGRIAGEVTVRQLIESGRVDPQSENLAQLAESIGSSLASGDRLAGNGIQLERTTTEAGEQVEFNFLTILAPGMALMFLMFTVTNGGRTLLLERAQGTLPRLLVSPTRTGEVLGGKVLGIYLTGVVQMVILILASTLMFQLRWGNLLGVALLVLAAVFGATGWGLLLTAVSRSMGQVSGLGSALMLIFGLLGGSFFDISQMPGWVRTFSKITPNAWGIDGFAILGLGGSWTAVLEPVVALLIMGAVLSAAAALLFNRNRIAQR
jgi:ABC-2 type transport system permease protein